MIYKNLLESIGNTPVIKIKNLAPSKVNLYVKAEYFNPGGSVKDRLALSIIEKAEQDGSLKPNQTVVEATSGNTGIGLAMVCANKGYPCVVTMPDSTSVERRKLMRFLGAKVLLTPASEGTIAAYNLAKNLSDKKDWFYARQFENEANYNYHMKTTANEIFSQTNGLVDGFTCAIGTGGTLTGVSLGLKDKNENIKIACTDSQGSSMYNYFVNGKKTLSFWVPLDPVKDASLRMVASSHKWGKQVLPTKWLSQENFWKKRIYQYLIMSLQFKNR